MYERVKENNGCKEKFKLESGSKGRGRGRRDKVLSGKSGGTLLLQKLPNTHTHTFSVLCETEPK